MFDEDKIPPPPPGFVLLSDQETTPPPPPGFVLESDLAEKKKLGDVLLGGSKATIGPTKKPVKEPFNFKEFIGRLPINIGRGIAEFVKSAPEIGPGITRAALDVEQDIRNKGFQGKDLLALRGWDVVKSVSENIAEPVVKGYVGGWKEMIKDPAGFAQNRPADFANNILDALTGGLLVAVKGAGLVTKVARARKAILADKALTAEKAKSIVQPILNDVNKLGKENIGDKWNDLRFEEPGTVYNQAGVVIGQERVPEKGFVKDWFAGENPAFPTPKREVKWGEGNLVDKPAEVKRIDRDIDEIVQESSAHLQETPVEYPATEAKPKPIINQAPKPPNPEMKVYTLGGDVSDMVNKLVVPNIKTGLKAVGQAMHSPDKVMGIHPVGRQIWENFDSAELNKLRWISDRIDETKEITKFVKPGSPISTAVQKIRDAVKNVEDVIKLGFDEASKIGLTKEEFDAISGYKEFAIGWDKHLDAAYDSTLRAWGKGIAGDKEGELWAKANEARRTGKNPTAEFFSKLTDDETKVYNLYKNKIEKYITHVFPKTDLLGYLEMELNSMTTKLSKVRKASSREKIGKYIEELKKSIENVKNAKSPFEGMPPEVRSAYEAYAGGNPIFYDVLPKKISDRFFKRRTGAAGYVNDSVVSYHTYLGWMARKIFDEPAVRYAAAHFNELPMELKDYSKWFIRNYMGMNRDPLSKPMANVKSLMWMKALGFNPRSALVNLTQRVNLIADANPIDVKEGYRLGWTDKGNELFNRTGLAKTVPTALMEGEVPNNSLEALREISGWMFSKVEEGNLKHSFLTGYSEGIRKGLSEADAIQSGIRKARKTQFRYGKVGTPKALRGAGGVAFQFWSYPIKQIEFLTDLAKNSPHKLIAWLGLAEGGNYALQDFLDTDLSSALGLGLNYGELIEAFKDVPTGDLRRMFYHLRQSAQSGTGLLPAGPGPAITLINAVSKAFPILAGEKPASELLRQTVPVVAQRGSQLVGSLKEGPSEEGLYNIRDIATGKASYQENLRQLLQRTIGPKPMAETKVSRERRKESLDILFRNAVSKQIAEMLAAGDTDGARKLADKYGNSVWPTKQSIQSARDRLAEKKKKISPKLKRFQEELRK